MRISTLAIGDNIYFKKCLSLKTQVILDGNTFLLHPKNKKRGSQKKREKPLQMIKTKETWRGKEFKKQVPFKNNDIQRDGFG